jgi:hypothetical protein
MHDSLVGEGVREIVAEWLEFLRTEKLFGPVDPLSPATEVGQDQYHFPDGRPFARQLGERLCRTPEEFKAWSQNLGHEQVLTTFSSYGQVAVDRQAELIRRLGRRQGRDTPKATMIERLIQVLQEEGRHSPE